MDDTLCLALPIVSLALPMVAVSAIIYIELTRNKHLKLLCCFFLSDRLFGIDNAGWDLNITVIV